jgi:hypothetical protein
MLLILEIAAGVFLGVCLLGIVFGMIPEYLRQRRIERNYERSVQSRFKRAEEQGATDLVSLYDLEIWEREHDTRDALTIAMEEVSRGISAGRPIR